MPDAVSGEAVLIAAYSGRALAQSARRAGYLPLVVDAFGDLDMREAAEHHVHMSDALTEGFRAKPLIAALDTLVAKSEHRPIGLVVGSGFEDRPKLLQQLDEHYKLRGTSAQSVKLLKDPTYLADMCRRLDIPHPETTTLRPQTSNGWLTKQIGGTGGGHVVRGLTGKPAQKSYFQRELGGVSQSLFAIISKSFSYTAPTRQWSIETPGRPFRYGGAVRHYPSENIANQMNDTTCKLIDEVELRGIVSFDFRVVDDTAYLLEVNPRPGATLDLFDSREIPLFQSHLYASDGELFNFPETPDDAPLAALLYAPSATTMPRIDWPEWTADRTPPGTPISVGQPLATIFANGPTADAAEALAHERLAILVDLIYGHSK